MARSPLVQLEPGEVIAIPLFLTSEPPLTRFRAHAFQDRGDEFVFCRVIEDKRGAGIIIEVFDHVGGLGADIAHVVAADRLFRPVAITGLGIYKKRWPRIGVCDPYDRERDSGYSQIQLVTGTRDRPQLWQDGVETPIDVETAKQYEPWELWDEPDLETRIVAALAARASGAASAPAADGPLSVSQEDSDR
jgi:hypothetical protein